MSIPYTYLLRFLPENKFYYGVRYKKDCNPSDLFLTYFTSSKEVKKLIDEYGKESFDYEIRRTFHNSDDARKWETKVLTRIKATQRKDFLNKTNNISIPNELERSPETKRKIGDAHRGKIVSEETKNKISNNAKERYKNKENHPRYGKKLSQETKNKIGKIHKGKIISDEQKKKLSNISKERIKLFGDPLSKYRERCLWEITLPDNTIILSTNLGDICREYNLTKTLMIRTSQGKQTHHKNFKCKKLYDLCNVSK